MTIPQRFENWATLLSAFLMQQQQIPFEWGQHDCILFPADCINALTGLDLGAAYRGTYTDQEGAQAILDANFGGVISGVFYAMLGDPIPYTLRAKRGDVVMADINGVACGGVVDDTGRRVAFITQDRGLIRLPLNGRMIAWGYG